MHFILIFNKSIIETKQNQDWMNVFLKVLWNIVTEMRLTSNHLDTAVWSKGHSNFWNSNLGYMFFFWNTSCKFSFHKWLKNTIHYKMYISFTLEKIVNHSDWLFNYEIIYENSSMVKFWEGHDFLFLWD